MRQRKGCYDEIRCFATILVLLVHILGTVVSQFESLEIHKIYKFIFGSIIGEMMVCNGLFIALSGALLLPYREESVWNFFRKRIMKTLIPLVIYYLFYLWVYDKIDFSMESFIQAFKTIFSGADSQTVPHFWLFYVILNLYIVMPLLRWMVKEISESLMVKIVFFIIGLYLIEFLLHCVGINQTNLPFVYGWEAYLFCGYFLTLECSKKYEKFFVAAGIVSALMLPIIDFIILPGAENANYIIYDKSPWILMMTMALMILFMRRSKEPNIIVKVISKYSFSILMIHWYIMFYVLPVYLQIHLLMFGKNGFLLALFLQFVLGGVLSFMAAVVIDKTIIQLINKLFEKLKI